ncbi:hypothetical protein [Pedobacter miscanthi]|nr:hypothetical protein [Pedobacter miscanthi]
MKKVQASKEKVISVLQKIIAEKNAVRTYMQGQITLDQLTKKGIKLAKPL